MTKDQLSHAPVFRDARTASFALYAAAALLASVACSKAEVINKGSGGTNWLKTTAPVDPGETVTVSFIIFDEGDGILDSAVNIDNFRWGSASIGSPVTGR